MNRILILSWTCLLTSFVVVFGQDYDTGEYLVSTGSIPQEFIKLSSEKYKEEATKIDKKGKAKIKRTQRDFYLETSFETDEMLASGKLLFNDPVTIYVNKVADIVLARNKKLRDSLRFYVTRSSAVNAFCYANGMICINIGLLSHIKSEAELAMTISHEIVHFVEKHSLVKYIDHETNKEYKEMSLEERVLSRCNFSKEKETEADLKGLELYLAAGYATEALDGDYDLLRYDYLPFEQVLFKKSFFETDNLKFPSTYNLDVINAITTGVDYDDSKSTHPNVEKRRSQITKLANELAREKKGKKFILSEKEFNAMSKLARYEMTRLYVLDKDYTEAIYNSFLLLQTNPKSKYLKMSIMYGLYFLTKYKNRGNLSNVMMDYEDMEGDSQPLYYLIDQMTKEELNATATVYAWRLKKEYPGNKYIDSVAYDLVDEMVRENNMKPESFSINPKVKKAKTTNYPSYVKRAPTEEELAEEKDFMKYAFVDILDNPEFVRAFYVAEQKRKDFEVKKYSFNYKKQEKKKKELIDRNGYVIGAEKVVFLSPDFIKVDFRKRRTIKYMASEQALVTFNKRIGRMCNQVGLDYEILHPKNFKSNDINAYNDHALLEDWFEEDHDFDYFSMFQPEMEKISKRYGTEKFCRIGTIGLTQKKTGGDGGTFFALSLFYFPLLPIAIVNAALPSYYTLYYCRLFDIVAGKRLMKRDRLINIKDVDYVLNSNLYDSMLQMKTKRKE